MTSLVGALSDMTSRYHWAVQQVGWVVHQGYKIGIRKSVAVLRHDFGFELNVVFERFVKIYSSEDQCRTIDTDFYFPRRLTRLENNKDSQESKG